MVTCLGSCTLHKKAGRHMHVGKTPDKNKLFSGSCSMLPHASAISCVSHACAQVECVEVPWGSGADEAKLEQILKADTDKKIKAVAVVHNETTTGVTSDIKQVREVSYAETPFQPLAVPGTLQESPARFLCCYWGALVAWTSRCTRGLMLRRL